MNRFLVCLLWLTALYSRAADPAPGAPIFGEHGYVEYLLGDLPIVFSAPHGGYLTPDEVAERTVGVRQADVNTQELARTVTEVIHERTGHRAHLIICHLHRSKLDANREIGEAAGDDLQAQQAWRDYHGFIEQARAAAVARFGSAFFIDLHGQGHPGQRVELGYLHSVEDLAREDSALDTPEVAAASSLRLIAERSHLPYPEIMRGGSSLGALLEGLGFPCTPSPSAPHPIAPYFRGGYSVERHCKVELDTVGLQIECFRKGLRDTAEKRLAFAHALVTALEKFLPAQLGIALTGDGAAPGSPVSARERAAQ